jgi:hypothetical protein
MRCVVPAKGSMKTAYIISASLFLAIILGSSVFGQQPQVPPPHLDPDPAAKAAAKPVISPIARLNAAKTVYIRKLPGNEIPYNVIANGFDGWAKYVVVASPEKADLVVEVSAPEVDESGIAISATTSKDDAYGKHDQGVKLPKVYTVNIIKMTVMDTHTKTPLWSAAETPRNAARKNKSQDNLVDAAQKLFQHFHDRVEPPPQ